MKFNSSTGSFQLSILGYVPQTTNWRDRNCLRCEVATDRNGRSDRQAAPLQTWEVNRLVSGLRSLWARAITQLSLSFSEPGLSVEAVALPNDHFRLQVQLDHALTPTWHRFPDFPVEMDVVLNRSQLQETIADLSAQLTRFPER